MGDHGPSLRGVLVVWVIYGLLTVASFGTYALVSPAEMYHVSHDGLAGLPVGR
jgi:hypothetical protein